MISILALIKYPNYQTPPSKGHVSGFKQAKPSEQHWDHSRFRGHLVLALAAVSPHTHTHAFALYFGVILRFSASRSYTLSDTRTHRQPVGCKYPSALARWGGEREWVSEAEEWEEKNSWRRRRRGERAWRNRRMLQSRYSNCLCGIVFLNMSSGLSLCACDCVCVLMCVWVNETLTALQGLFAPRENATGQHACRGQSLQGQDVLTLLPEKQRQCVCLCVTDVCVKEESRW